MKIKKSILRELKEAVATGIKKATTTDVRKSTGTVEVTAEHDENKDYSFVKYLKGMALHDWSDAPEELKLFKALNTQVGTEGGFIVPTQTSNKIIELLKDNAVVRNIPGVKVINMKSNSMEVGRLDTGPSITWGGENTTIASDTSVEFGLLTLKLKKAVCLYPMSREMIKYSNPSVEALLKSELAASIGLAEDLAFLEGIGGSQPLGLYYNTRILNTDLSAVGSYDDIYEAQMQVRNQKGEVSAWITNPTVEYTLRTLKDAEGRYLKNYDAGGPDRVAKLGGVPVHYTTQVPNTLRPGSNESYILGGDWKNFIIGQSGTLRIETSTEAGDSFAKDQLWIKVVHEVDCVLRHPETFVRIVGIMK